MLIVPIEQVEPGMRLAMPVTHPANPQQELLRRGFALDHVILDRLRALEIRALYVDYPGLESLDAYLAPSLSPERQALYGQLKTSMSDFQRAASPSVDYWEYHNATRDFLSALLDRGPHPIYLDQLSHALGAGAVDHGMAVAHLALVLGLKMQSYLIHERRHLRIVHAKDVVNLGIAGMLHDLGKTRLPEPLRAAHVLNPPDAHAARADYEAHAAHGFAMLRDTIKPTAAAAVLHHHQHFDGSGFPRLAAREGQEIHVYARILMAADLYERLAIGHDRKTRRTNLEILHLMRTRYAAWLDPEILQTMPRVCPPFPPGSKVTLSDGRAAIVTRIEADHPYHPVVTPLARDGRTLQDKPIRLRKCPELTIREANGITLDDTAGDPPRTGVA